MRRWTVLLIPHDTDQPRSFAVSNRALRVATVSAAALFVAAVVGVGAMAGWIARPSDGERAAELSAPAGDGVLGSGNAVDSLRATVEALYGALDTIRQADARLRAAAGVPPIDSASLDAHAEIADTRAAADSLLRGATIVAGRLGRLADSARIRDSARAKGSRAAPTAAGTVRR